MSQRDKNRSAKRAPVASAHTQGATRRPSAPTPAKLTRPTLPRIFHRSRLFDRFDETRACCQSIWIKAPPGSGKTTLVADYLTQRRIGGLWYSVDAEDNDVATFFHYLGLGARQAAPHHTGTLPHLSPEYVPGLDAFARRYFEALYSSLTPPYALVLDDYHDVPDDALLHQVLAVAIANVPHGGVLIVISRNEPPPSLARLQANGATALIGWEELRLTPEEAAGVAALRRPEPGQGGELPPLYELTDGWVAGLVLLLEQHARELPHTPAGPGVPRVLFDYFAGELFDKLDDRTRKILLMSAFLPVMTETAVAELAGISPSDSILNEFYQRNYFLSCHGSDPPTYRYHALFREFLLHRAACLLPEKERLAAARRAAGLLEDQGFLEDAVDLFRSAGQWPDVIRMSIAHAPRLIAEGRNRTVLEWTSGMPEELIAEHPWLSHWRGVAGLPFDPGTSRTEFDDAMAHFRLDVADQRVGFLFAWAAATSSVFLGSSDFTPLRRYIETFDALPDDVKGFPDSMAQAHVTLGMYSAIYIHMPDHPDMPYWDRRALELLHSGADPNLQLLLGAHMMVQRSWWGERSAAMNVMNVMRDIGAMHQVSPLSRIHIAVCDALCDWLNEGGTPEWSSKVRETVELSEEYGIHIWDVHVYGHGAACALSRGDLRTAEQMLDAMRRNLNRARVLDYGYYQYLAMWLALQREDCAEISARMLSTDVYVKQVGMPFSDALMNHALAHGLHKIGRTDEAEARLAEMSALAVRIGSHSVNFMLHLTRAQFALDKGDTAEAHGALTRAMAIGREKNLINAFGWIPAVMAHLCVVALEAGIEPEYVRSLVRTRQMVPDVPPVTLPIWPWPIRIRTLGRFAVEVHDEPIRFSGKAQKKPLELLQALISFGGREVAQTRLCEVLWPDADGDAAQRAFNTTLHRLRRLLENEAALQLSAGKLSLNPGVCWIDAWALERLAEPTAHRATAGSEMHASPNQAADRLVSLYGGAFLANETEQPWLLPARDRLRGKFVQGIESYGQSLEQCGDWSSAVTVYRKGLDADPVAEALYRRLMICHQRLGQVAEAKKVYQLCRATLAGHLAVAPSPETESLFRRISATA